MAFSQRLDIHVAPAKLVKAVLNISARLRGVWLAGSQFLGVFFGYYLGFRHHGDLGLTTLYTHVPHITYTCIYICFWKGGGPGGGGGWRREGLEALEGGRGRDGREGI